MDLDKSWLDAWEERLRKVKQSSCRLALVVGDEGSGKTAILRRLSEAFRLPRINLGEELSRKLLAVEGDDRARQVDGIMAELFEQNGTEAVALDNTEILFEPELALKPLEALKVASRKRLIIATWNGRLTSDSLSFGTASHPAYRTYALVSHSEVTFTAAEATKS